MVPYFKSFAILNEIIQAFEISKRQIETISVGVGSDRTKKYKKENGGHIKNCDRIAKQNIQNH